MIEHYTNWRGKIPERIFASLTWFWLTIVLALECLVAFLLQYLSEGWLIAGVMTAIAVIYAAYRVAKHNDGIVTSALATLVGAVGWAFAIGGYTSLFGIPNLFTVFICLTFFALVIGIGELAVPGFVAKRPWAATIVLISTAVVFEIGRVSLNWILGNLGIWEIVILAAFAFIAIYQYILVWKDEHTVDNAIDFSLEFLFEFLHLNLKKLKGEK